MPGPEPADRIHNEAKCHAFSRYWLNRTLAGIYFKDVWSIIIEIPGHAGSADFRSDAKSVTERRKTK